jgi:NADH-quinone oxidoreductase subunit L
MTFPLMVLAVGAILAGLVGIPAALGGPNTIEHFLEPSFTAAEIHEPAVAGREAPRAEPVAEPAEHHDDGASRGLELGLMVFSLMIAVIGIATAYKFYLPNPTIPNRLAAAWPGAYRLLLNKYYVDEVYNSTAVSGTFAGGRGLWIFDRRVIDGVVNGAGWAAVVGAWFSGLTDRTVVDGLVNLIGRTCEEGSFWFRKLQTGLVQNYALLMLFGVFAFVTVYLLRALGG